ncbi:uncharacterized protein L969DRAFT_92132 [Mixia osmundae IAM 14324]|uniref:D-lactate dehydratase n=1 Tax=Mixia osmundae (strain CBS 9802 / IAM 14324 / JCM 22182 / KY 12970) TaxID=764103 RepID=G7E7C6_MIXOS|nr:uncharacterized protein L969DRAFT_92132 [Mixia osmundae IAM 14324]KEI42703.1 hypothetical protein L969DRAFT_92132 [Mixia osmundae IAM 14324]GAA98736.1 hypothetical protein E5Q_05424 [Mixia osmundae IAM 14324]
MSEKRVLLLVAHGSEEMEVSTPYDVLVRAGLKPLLVSVGRADKGRVELSRGLPIYVHSSLSDLRSNDLFDAVLVPGGVAGARTISSDQHVQELLKSHYEAGKIVGCICAGSLAVKTSNIARGKTITSHPSVRDQLERDYRYSDERVVVDGNLITSRGPGTALLWALTLVEAMCGKAKRDEVASPMIVSAQL